MNVLMNFSQSLIAWRPNHALPTPVGPSQFRIRGLRHQPGVAEFCRSAMRRCHFSANLLITMVTQSPLPYGFWWRPTGAAEELYGF